MTTAQPDLYDRAAAIFGTEEGRILWPYGMSSPHPGERRTDPERYAQRLAQQQAKQECMVAWAEQYGLKYSPAGCCPAWLQGNVSRRCRPYGAGAERCTRYGNNNIDHDWLDHAVGWLKDGKPAVLTSAPYTLEMLKPPARLAFWAVTDERLKVAAGDGWYSPATTQLILWRADRIKDVQPATMPAAA